MWCTINISDRIFRLFENLVRPFELPLRSMPGAGAWQLVWHFAQLFRGVLVAVAALSVVSAGIGLEVVWALDFVVDGVAAQGAETFVAAEVWTLTALVFLFAVVDPVVTFVRGAFMAQTVQVLLPAAMRWQAHKAVEGQDVAFFEDVFAGQVASRIGQVTGAVQRSMMIAMQMVPRIVIAFGDVAERRFYRDWIEMRDAIGLGDDEQFVIHMLRHTCCTRLLSAGVDIRTTMQWMGHTSIQMTQRYAHFIPKNMDDAADALDELTQKTDNPSSNVRALF
jgi:ABC-type multidrug transport system fused ATPase/permease subunit